MNDNSIFYHFDFGLGLSIFFVLREFLNWSNDMGGNALKFTKTRRFQKDEYLRVAEHLKLELSDLLGVRVEVIPAYKNKESFGDLDLLVQSNNLPNNWEMKLIQFYKLSDKMFVKNSNVFSFAYNELQVDVILTPASEFDSSLQYFAYNDLGNLLGRLTHKFGLKFGHRGLSFVLRVNDEPIKEYFLERKNSYQTVCEILGLDSSTEFHDLTDIFKFVASSKFFDPDIFLLENRGQLGKRRDKNRKTYHGFLEWIKETNPKSNHKFTDKTEFGGYKVGEPYFTEIVLDRYPYLKDEIKNELEKFHLEKQFKDSFNGELFIKLTGLMGKQLGEFISFMSNSVTEEFKNQVRENPDVAKEFVLEQFELFSKRC